MTWYEVRSDNGIVSKQYYSRDDAAKKASQMARMYDMPMRVYMVQAYEREILSIGRPSRCA